MQTVNFLPLPKNVVYAEGTFAVTPDKPLFHNKFRLRSLLLPIFEFIRQYLHFNAPLDPIRDGLLDARLSKEPFLLFWTSGECLPRVNEDVNPDLKIPMQGYILRVTPEYVLLQSTDVDGFWNGVQTLSQILEQVFLGLVRQGGLAVSFDIPCLQVQDAPSMEIRGFHIDLKQMMYRFNYLREFCNLLPQYKLNAILLEWEDKFPYTKDLQVIRHKYSLTSAQVDELIQTCRRNRIEVIPLIQVFGHLNFLLKHDNFIDIREIPENTQSVCPLNLETIRVIQVMIHQICEKHPESRFLHLGGNDIAPFGACPQCKEFTGEKGESQLYVDYINKVAQIVKAEGKIPIIWSDFILKYPAAIGELDSDVNIMYWDFDANSSEVDYLWTNGVARNLEIYEHNPPEFLHAIEKYITTPSFPASVRALPFVEFFQDRGFKVLGAPSTNSGCSWTTPNLAQSLPNIACHAARITAANALGVVVTSCVKAAVPLETQWHAILWGADQCWTPHPFNLSTIASFDARFNATYFGCPEPALHNLTELFLSIITNPEHKLADGRAHTQEMDISQVFEGIQEIQQIATKDQDTLELLELGVKGHQLLFHLMESLTRAEDTFIQVEETGADMPFVEDIALKREELEVLLGSMRDYCTTASRILESSEGGILSPGEMRNTFDQILPMLMQPVEIMVELLGETPPLINDILQNAYRRRIGKVFPISNT